MELTLKLGALDLEANNITVMAAYQTEAKAATKSKSKAKSKTKKDDKKKLSLGHLPKEVQSAFADFPAKDHFEGGNGETVIIPLNNKNAVILIGMGDKTKVNPEKIRKTFANFYKDASQKYKEVAIWFDTFLTKGKSEATLKALSESIGMTNYRFDKYKSTKKEPKLKNIVIASKEKKTKLKKWNQILNESKVIAESINFGRDLVNEAPNILHSVNFAKRVVDDAKGITRVKSKVLGKAQLKKEKMGLFLSVNAGSHYEPQLVHLTYTPKKVNSKTKHIALVGKGLTFDTGGYSLKPSASIINMKFDMAGAATVYAAFRAAAMLDANVKISCFLGMTDNAISSTATLPDSIVKARNGKTVEILNTDAEGRLVLADVLDYACDQKPHAIVDAATLTGACLVALGHEVCALMGNNKKLSGKLLKSAEEVNERMWELPIIDEFREAMVSPIADLKNISSGRYGGTAKAAAFLENFIKNDIEWAHLDIAGIGCDQGHLPYCPSKGASGLIVRTLINFIQNG